MRPWHNKSLDGSVAGCACRFGINGINLDTGVVPLPGVQRIRSRSFARDLERGEERRLLSYRGNFTARVDSNRDGRERLSKRKDSCELRIHAGSTRLRHASSRASRR